ncbi:MAG: hypothetical protein HFI34_07645 [Lachnospiraceae bacterium]|nr:hypothetical protein [Lachnospiraceae bacterium]
MKLMVKKRIQGSISLLLVAILLPTMMFSALMVDISRLNLAKSMVSSAGDVALNSALANYDTILKDVYGLFSVSQTEEDWNENIRRYFEETVVSYGIVSEEDASDYVSMLLGNVAEYILIDGGEPVDFLNMSLEDFQISGMEGSTLCNPQILKKQIVEYMKYRGPVVLGLGFLDSLKAFDKVEDQSEVIEVQVKAQESTQKVSDACKDLYEKIDAYQKKYDETVLQGENNLVYEYAKRVESYKDTWKPGEKQVTYKEIHTLLLEFNLTDFNEDVKKISIDTELKDGANGFKNINEAIAAIRANLEKAEKSEVNNKFNNKKYFDSSQLNEDKSEFINTGTASKQFREYKKYLFNLDKDVNKGIVEGEAKSFNTLTKAIGAYNYYATQQINEYSETISNKNEEKENLNKQYSQNGDRIDDIIKELSDVNNKINSNEVTYIQSILSNNLDMSNNYNEYKNLKKNMYKGINADSNRITTLETIFYNFDSKFSEYIKNNIDNIVKKELLEEEKEELIAKNFTISRNMGKFQIEIDFAKKNKDALERKKEDYTNRYNKIKDKYKALESSVNSRIDIYKDYKACAKKQAGNWVKLISEDLSKVKKHLEDLKLLLEAAIKQCDTVKAEIEAYESKIKDWENANNTYSSKDGEDTFSQSNKTEIESVRKDYNKNDLDKLKKLLEEQKGIIQEYLTYINNSTSYKYGVKKIAEIKDYDRLVQAVKQNSNIYTELKNQKVLSDNQLEAYFKKLYSNYEHIEKPNTDAHTILPDSSYLKAPLSIFGCFLKETYGNSKKDDSIKADYESAKDESEVAANKENKNTEDSDGSTGGAKEDKYGYTYKSILKESIEKSDLPSGLSDSSVSSGSVNTDKVSDSYSSQKSVVSSILSGISGALKEGRDDLFVLQYIFENFSYAAKVQTDLVDEGKKSSELSEDELKAYMSKTLSGFPINSKNNFMYGAEIEYMLYGNKTPSKNVDSAKATIFAIRFICNSIYAFTNSEIKATTQAAGLAVQAATAGVVPYQVVQIALQMALALAESAIDMDHMMNGEKVAVIKAKETWTMSLSGAGREIGGKLKEQAKKYAGTIIKDIFGELQNGIVGFIDSSTENLKKSTTQLIKTVTQATTDKAFELTNNMFGEMEVILEDKLYGLLYLEEKCYKDIATFKSYVGQKFNEIRNEVDKFGERYTDNISKEIWGEVRKKIDQVLATAETEFYKELDSRVKGASNMENAIISSINGIINKIKDTTAVKIYEMIDKLREPLEDSANSIVSKYSGEVKRLAEDVTDEAKDKILTATDNFIDSTFDGLSGNSNASGGLNNGVAIKNSSKLKTTITFGYKDYLMMFVFINLTVNEDNLLKRVGDVIQLNIMNAKKGEASYFHDAGTDFRLKNAYTYVAIKANLDMNMFFMDNVIFKGQINEINEGIKQGSFGDDVSNIDLKQGNNVINYIGIAGY